MFNFDVMIKFVINTPSKELNKALKSMVKLKQKSSAHWLYVGIIIAFFNVSNEIYCVFHECLIIFLMSLIYHSFIILENLAANSEDWLLTLSVSIKSPPSMIMYTALGR